MSSENPLSTPEANPVSGVDLFPAGVYRVNWSDDGTVAVDVISLGKTSAISGVENKGVVSLLSHSGDEENCVDLIAVTTSTKLESVVTDYLSFCSEENDLLGAKQITLEAFKKVNLDI